MQTPSLSVQDEMQRTDLNVKNVPLSDVIDALSAIFEVSIVAGVETSRPVSVNLYQSSLEEALDWVLRSNCSCARVAASSGARSVASS